MAGAGAGRLGQGLLYWPTGRGQADGTWCFYLFRRNETVAREEGSELRGPGGLARLGEGLSATKLEKSEPRAGGQVGLSPPAHPEGPPALGQAPKTPTVLQALGPPCSDPLPRTPCPPWPHTRPASSLS